MNRLLYLILVLLLLGCNDKKSISTQQPSQMQVRSEAEMHSFWDKELKSIIADQLFGRQHPFQEINDRMTEVLVITSKRFNGNVIAVNLATNYHRLSNLIEASSGIDNGKPMISLYIPSIMDQYDQCKSRGGAVWRELFANHVTVVCLHETDHLVLGEESQTNIDAIEEARIWAETVQKTLTPLVEKHNQPIVMSDFSFYQDWITAGKANNTSWQTLIQKRYSSIDGLK